jgi:hypothetical protein
VRTCRPSRSQSMAWKCAVCAGLYIFLWPAFWRLVLFRLDTIYCWPPTGQLIASSRLIGCPILFLSLPLSVKCYVITNVLCCARTVWLARFTLPKKSPLSRRWYVQPLVFFSFVSWVRQTRPPPAVSRSTSPGLSRDCPSTTCIIQLTDLIKCICRKSSELFASVVAVVDSRVRQENKNFFHPHSEPLTFCNHPALRPLLIIFVSLCVWIEYRTYNRHSLARENVAVCATRSRHTAERNL